VKSAKPSDWAYLIVSFALTVYLLKVEREGFTASDAKAAMYFSVAKWCRKANIALMEMELRALRLCDDELEKRL
jgi:hypothetical protein